MNSAITSVPLHPLLAGRWSPRAFTEDELTATELAAVTEAARWAPSAVNIQPWRFIIARRGEQAFKRITTTLAGANGLWAPGAAALIVALSEDSDESGTPIRYAHYDLGQAVAHLSIQAEALGLAVHQMGGFDAGVLRAEFAIPPRFTPLTVIALGHRGPADLLAEPLRERESAGRERRAHTQTFFDGEWGQPLLASDGVDQA